MNCPRCGAQVKKTGVTDYRVDGKIASIYYCEADKWGFEVVESQPESAEKEPEH